MNTRFSSAKVAPASSATGEPPDLLQHSESTLSDELMLAEAPRQAPVASALPCRSNSTGAAPNHRPAQPQRTRSASAALPSRPRLTMPLQAVPDVRPSASENGPSRHRRSAAPPPHENGPPLNRRSATPPPPCAATGWGLEGGETPTPPWFPLEAFGNQYRHAVSPCVAVVR